MLWVTGGGGGGDGGREGAAAAAEGGGDLERSPHHLHTSCLSPRCPYYILLIISFL